MIGQGANWSIQQLAEFLAVVSSFGDEDSATAGAIERAAEALEAEVGAILMEQRVTASVGFPHGKTPERELVALVASGETSADIPGLGPAAIVSVPLEEERPGHLLLARVGDDGFSVEERTLLRSMGRVLGMTRRMLERQHLLERLSKIQRSISHRAPLQEVLDAVTTGAGELLGVEVVGLRVIDPDDPSYSLIVSASGVGPELLEEIRRSPLDRGAGGRAIVEDRLVIVENYDRTPGMVPGFADDRLKVAMAAPVRQDGVVAGSLVVASYRAERRFSESEQEALLALAEHASLALTDAKTVDAMREAQRSKDMFLAMVSHELKTPLTVIMGALRTLEVHGRGLPEDLAQEMLSAGWERGKELERLINRLLQGARAELAGGEEQVTLSDLLEEAAKGFEHTRTLDIRAGSDAVVRVDRSAVMEVLGILLENAVAHSPVAAVIGIHGRVDSVELTIDVSNPGSLPEDLDPQSLFAPFQRGSDTRTPGVGLGLYIAGRVTQSLGGTLEVDEGDGMVTFRLRVPVFEVGSGLPEPATA